jgi:hypothetical protein
MTITRNSCALSVGIAGTDRPIERLPIYAHVRMHARVVCDWAKLLWGSKGFDHVVSLQYVEGIKKANPKPDDFKQVRSLICLQHSLARPFLTSGIKFRWPSVLVTSCWCNTLSRAHKPIHVDCTFTSVRTRAEGGGQAQTEACNEPRALDAAITVDAPFRLLVILRFRGYHGLSERAQPRRQIRCQVPLIRRQISTVMVPSFPWRALPCLRPPAELLLP